LALHAKVTACSAAHAAAKLLTTAFLVACRTDTTVRAARKIRAACVVIVVIAAVQSAEAQERLQRPATPEIRYGSRVLQTASIHWQDVPLRDAVGRMQRLFDEAVFVDRRLDPNTRITLDMTATGAAQAVTQIAAKHDWGPSRVGGVVYLGPGKVARILGIVADARKKDIAKLPPAQRAVFQRKRPLKWPRLTEPRELVTSLIERSGWRVGDAERIPHDLWSAGELTELPLAEQLTLLLIGFDLTFELQPSERTVRIIALESPSRIAATSRPSGNETPAPESSAVVQGPTKQVYTLRVEAKPVGAVTREVARRLNWQVEFDVAAIKAAGRSLDERVSFNVENVEEDALLDALLRPAGLTFRRDGERIVVVPGDGS
jgi:hypothetical protein